MINISPLTPRHHKKKKKARVNWGHSNLIGLEKFISSSSSKQDVYSLDSNLRVREVDESGNSKVVISKKEKWLCYFSQLPHCPWHQQKQSSSSL